jgi:Fe-S cluster assembly protein SufD
VGSIEDEHRFYLESRGVPPEVAERLIVFGFFNDVLDRMPRGVDVEPLRRAVADKLAAEAVLTAGAAS